MHKQWSVCVCVWKKIPPACFLLQPVNPLRWNVCAGSGSIVPQICCNPGAAHCDHDRLLGYGLWAWLRGHCPDHQWIWNRQGECILVYSVTSVTANRQTVNAGVRGRQAGRQLSQTVNAGRRGRQAGRQRELVAGKGPKLREFLMDVNLSFLSGHHRHRWQTATAAGCTQQINKISMRELKAMPRSVTLLSGSHRQHMWKGSDRFFSKQCAVLLQPITALTKPAWTSDKMADCAELSNSKTARQVTYRYWKGEIV